MENEIENIRNRLEQGYPLNGSRITQINQMKEDIATLLYALS